MICLPGAEGGGGQRPNLHLVGTSARDDGATALHPRPRPVDASAGSGSR
jgi:hypothetical protein